MAIPLTRIQARDLPTGKPLPYPVFSKSGRLLLAKGCLFPENLAEDLLAIGIYRISDDSILDSDVLLGGGDTTEQKFEDLLPSVESTQFSFLEPGLGRKTVVNVDFIGMIPGTSLITSLPQRTGKVINLEVGQVLNVKICTGRLITGFISRVICSYKFPRPHVHIEYPNLFKTMVLRHAERVKVRILGILKKSDDVGLPVSIVELSGSGLAFTSEFEVGKVGDNVSLHFTLNLKFSSYPVTVNGIIRQARAVRSKKIYRFGVELTGLTDEQKLIIQASIYENL